MDEQLLIDGCKRGETSARKELHELYAPAMMSVCARYVRDRETARDLLQDGFIKVFTKIQTYSATGPFGAWVRRIFVTTALEYLRKYDALRLSAPIDEYGEQVEDADASVLDRLSADDLLECISRLPNGYRTVFNLYAIEGYTGHAEYPGDHFPFAVYTGAESFTGNGSIFNNARRCQQKQNIRSN